MSGARFVMFHSDHHERWTRASQLFKMALPQRHPAELMPVQADRRDAWLLVYLQIETIDLNFSLVPGRQGDHLLLPAILAHIRPSEYAPTL